MEFTQLIAARYSVRSYLEREVPDDILTAVLNAARLAPTACNRQPFQLLLAHTKDRKEELSRIYARPWFVQAPLIVGVCSETAAAWVRRDGKNFAEVDATIAMDHLILAAANHGLGTCWVANFDVTAAREVFGIPTEFEPVAFTPLGYPADQAPTKKRRPLSELVRWERW